MIQSQDKYFDNFTTITNGTYPYKDFNFMKPFLTIPLLLAYTFFSYLMLDITLQYIPYHTDVAFLRIKQDEVALGYYRLSFFVHVYTSMFVLVAGFTQFSSYILRQYPKVHRYGGWVYAMTIILFSGPSGLVMGYHANGGLPSQLAFCILAILWIYFTIMAIRAIRKKDIQSHKRFMIRSFALTLSAITLRLWKFILVYLFEPRPMDAYQIVAWLGWVLNLIIAELIIFKYYSNQNSNQTKTELI